MNQEVKKILLSMLLLLLAFFGTLIGLDFINSKLDKNIAPYKADREIQTNPIN
jgi:hypothetical protein